MSPTLSLTTVTDTPAQPLTPALDAGAVDNEAADQQRWIWPKATTPTC